MTDNYKSKKYNEFSRIVSEDHNDSELLLLENIQKEAQAIFGEDDVILEGLWGTYQVTEDVPSPSMQVYVSAGLAYNKAAELLYLDTPLIVVVPAADAFDTRYDIVQIKLIYIDSAAETRDVIDPPTKRISPAGVFTKLRGSVRAEIKTGTPGGIAPTVDSGYIKLAEIRVLAGAASITSADIWNVTSTFRNIANSNWTNETDVTYIAKNHLSHRSDAPADHAPGSITALHINMDIVEDGGGLSKDPLTGQIKVITDDVTIEKDPTVGPTFGELRVKDDGISGQHLNPSVAGAGIKQDITGNLVANIDQATIIYDDADPDRIRVGVINALHLNTSVAGAGIAGGGGAPLNVALDQRTGLGFNGDLVSLKSFKLLKNVFHNPSYSMTIRELVIGLDTYVRFEALGGTWNLLDNKGVLYCINKKVTYNMYTGYDFISTDTNTYVFYVDVSTDTVTPTIVDVQVATLNQFESLLSSTTTLLPLYIYDNTIKVLYSPNGAIGIDNISEIGINEYGVTYRLTVGKGFGQQYSSSIMSDSQWNLLGTFRRSNFYLRLQNGRMAVTTDSGTGGLSFHVYETMEWFIQRPTYHRMQLPVGTYNFPATLSFNFNLNGVYVVYTSFDVYPDWYSAGVFIIPQLNISLSETYIPSPNKIILGTIDKGIFYCEGGGCCFIEESNLNYATLFDIATGLTDPYESGWHKIFLRNIGSGGPSIGSVSANITNNMPNKCLTDMPCQQTQINVPAGGSTSFQIHPRYSFVVLRIRVSLTATQTLQSEYSYDNINWIIMWSVPILPTGGGFGYRNLVTLPTKNCNRLYVRESIGGSSVGYAVFRVIYHI